MFNVKAYTLIQLLNLGNDDLIQLLKTLRFGKHNKILSVVELLDDSYWELPMLRSFFLKLESQLCKMFPGCHIKPESNLTEPTLEEVDLYSYLKAKYV